MQNVLSEVFYNEYFSSLADFNLDSLFERKENDNVYVGTISPKKSNHPISIDVEIPFTFPYHKLVFWTNSLRGYPHLIYEHNPYLTNDNDRDKGWFCLNTPFAETAELQLAEEISRLHEWLNRFDNKDLPAVIEDPKVIFALQNANLYHWEHADEMREHIHFFGMTFIGDFANKPTNFRKSGVLYAYKRSNRYDDFHLFVTKAKGNTDMQIPYIIEDQFCGWDALNSFAAMRDFYHWDEATQERLLPEFTLTKNYELDEGRFYWYASHIDQIIENRKKIVIAPEDGSAIDEAIEKIKHLKHNPPKCFDYLNEPEDEDSPEYEEYLNQQAEEMQAEAEYEKFMYAWHYFALGIKENNFITWLLIWTNRNSRQYRINTYSMGEYEIVFNEQALKYHIDIDVKHIKDVDMNYLISDTITEKHFFGRGKLNRKLEDAKIAILGAGAIGSELAISLARGGCHNIGIWDSDYVEPGNLCRSEYDLESIGTNKAHAMEELVKKCSPFCEVRYFGDFYANINYEDQENVIKELDDYDIIFDCTAKNEILHFLSYAIKDKSIISLCITNRAQNLLCITNKEGNPYEIRKTFLAKIIQDTKNYYLEGPGCYSPTFLATKCDISALLNLAIRDVNLAFEDNLLPESTIYTYDRKGVLADKLHRYTLEDESISLIVSDETLLDAQDLPDVANGHISVLYGRYSADGHEIYLTDFAQQEDAKQIDINSDGLIEYIGEFRYSTEIEGEYSKEAESDITLIAADNSVNTNNPLLALRNPSGDITFYLYIDNKLELMLERK